MKKDRQIAPGQFSGKRTASFLRGDDDSGLAFFFCAVDGVEDLLLREAVMIGKTAWNRPVRHPA